MENWNSLFEANRQSWNKRTAVHKDSAFYDLPSFKKGSSSLNKIEVEEVGRCKRKSNAAPAMPFWIGYHELGKGRRSLYRCGF